VAAGARAVLRRARVCVLGRLGRDLNIYELCSTRTRRVYLALCSSPLPRHTLTLNRTRTLACKLARLGRAAGWPRPPPRPASCPDEAAATGKRPLAALPGRLECGMRPGKLGACCGRPGPRGTGRGARSMGLWIAPDSPGGRPEPTPPCFRRTATSRSSYTKGSRGSQRSATNK
jgi:hypothetical protein